MSRTISSSKRVELPRAGLSLMYLRGGSHCSRGQKTSPAVHGPSLRRIERHCGLLSALGAGHSHFNSLFESRVLGRRYRREPIVFGLFAWLATLRFILQSLVVKDHLFADRPNEVFPAIDAGDRSILKVRRLFCSGVSCLAV